jgi:DNA-binding transcriptional ArsR family regulator
MPRTQKTSTPKSAWPAPSFEVTELEQLRVLADPLRMRILNNLFQEPLTVKQVADRLELPATKLYYHVSELERIGLVKVVKTRVKSGIVEKYFQTVAGTIRISRELLKLTGGALDDGAYAELLASIFEAVADDLRQAIIAGVLPRPSAHTPKTATIGRTDVRLTRTTAARLARKFAKLLEEVEAADDVAGETEFGCALAFFPTKHLKPAGASPHD